MIIWLDHDVKLEDTKETYFLGVDRTSPPPEKFNANGSRVVGYEKLPPTALPYICGPQRWKRLLYKTKKETESGN